MTAWDDASYRRNRRAFLGRSAGSLGLMALAHLLDQQRGGGRVFAAGPEAARLPRPARKSVICLFQHGGPSQMDLFDPKPMLSRYDGKPYPGGKLEVHFNSQSGNVLGSPFRFAPQGESGMVLSELLPHTSAIADEITLVRSMTTESVDHEAALRLIHSGKILAGRPTLGSWVVYALGSENHDLPAYVVLSDPGGLPVDGVRNWSSGWLPAVYQGTPFRSGANPVLNLETPKNLTPEARVGQLRFLDALNRSHLARHAGDTDLEARIANFETAAQMQTAVPDALDLESEPKSIRRMYGLDDETTREYGARCLTARRLIERGVRFVQLFMSGQPWDTHSKNAETLKSLCAEPTSPARRWSWTCAARAARRHDRPLDRRVRSAAGLAGQGRPRPQPPRVLALAGRRRLQARVRPRCDRRFRLRLRDRRRVRPGPSGDHAPRPRPRPPPPRLPPRGPRRQPHRPRSHPRQDRPGPAGVSIAAAIRVRGVRSRSARQVVSQRRPASRRWSRRY